ncbi:MAG TPA: T6SS effector amidase Tae4 family protein [Myxococcota bacterium]|nr:T6SS effector amidase Tae4 family protein [Myxococcota bacterium]HQK49936.1 T6SS effector amidase Tae4 family protein [Myxococcota bacterium]
MDLKNTRDPVPEADRADGPQVAPAPARGRAVQRVLKRRPYREQQALLRHGGGGAVGPGEEADLARAGFSTSPGPIPHRARMEQAFGQPLGDVKAHVGPDAEAASEALGAEAYTVGNEVAFRDRDPSPATVAHEVAHVVQQRQGDGPGRTEGGLEIEAEAAAQRAASGGTVGALGADRTPGRPRKKPLPKDFGKMWEAHPHNYQEHWTAQGGDPSQDTASADLLGEVGLPTNWNTCAIRLSRMLNRIGERITPARTQAAGLKRKPYWSRKTQEYLILAAGEMWTYLQKTYRKADATFPAKGRYPDAQAFQKDFDRTIKPLLKGRKGIVAFDKIFGYGGTGHVDLFDGERLSDAPGWYPSERLMLWYVVVP